jgi:hypothetical protein
MKNDLKKPCKDCPWRRASSPGWLGDGDPEYFLSSALADEFGGVHEEHGSYAEPCHLTVDYSDDAWAEKPEEVQVCVGALIFYRNVDQFKLPRQPERSELICSVEPDHEAVFSTPEEFREHHTGERSMRSWEFAIGGRRR